MDQKALIAVLMGGPGSEQEVSVASGRAVIKALRDEGINAVGVEAIDREPALPFGTDLVFNAIHGTFGEDGSLQAYLEDLNLPYTGAGVESSRLTFDKVASKERFSEHGLPTPKWEVLDLSDGIRRPEMALPWVVKPPREGSSVGVHIVREESEVEAALADVAKYGEVLVEEFIEGKELTVGIVGEEVFPIVQIVPHSGFYDLANKYPWMEGGGGTDYYCPADLDPDTTARIQEISLKAHQVLGIEIYSRVDVLLDSLSNPYILEANTIPGMTSSSLLPKAATVAEPGYEFGPLCVRIADLSLALRRTNATS